MLKKNYIREDNYTKRKYQIIDDSFNGLTRVRSYETEKYGYIDNSGNLVIPCIYKSATNFGDGYAVVTDDESDKIINTKGEVISKGKMDYYISNRFHNGLFVIFSNYRIYNRFDSRIIKKFNYVNVKGEKLLSDDVDYASEFSDGLALIYMGYKPMIIDTEGKHHPELLEEYQKLGETNKGLTLDKSGFKNGLLKITNYDNTTYGYVYKDGHVFGRNDDLDSLHNLTMPQCLVEKPIDPYCDLLNNFYSNITYFGETITLSADTKEELAVKKREFYEELKADLNNFIKLEIDPQLGEEQGTMRKL